MLHIKFHIKFSKEKSNILIIGKKHQQNNQFMINNGELEETSAYKYLGITFNITGNLQDLFKKIKGKVETAL